MTLDYHYQGNVLSTLVSGTRRQRKGWIDDVKEDRHQTRSDVPQAAECDKDRKRWKKYIHAVSSFATHR